MDELFKTIGKQAKWLLNVTNDVKDHTRELDALKAAHQKVASEQNSQEQRLTQLQREKEDLHARHMSLEERVDYLEKLLEKSAEKHTQEIERFKGKFLQMSGLMRDQVSGEQKTREGHASIEERLKYLESTIEDNAALTEKHEGFADRLDFIEKARDQERREFDAEVQALKHRLQQVQDSNGEACSEVAEVTKLAEEVEALRRQLTEGEPAQKVEHLEATVRELQDIHEDLKKVEKAGFGEAEIADLKQQVEGLKESTGSVNSEWVELPEEKAELASASSSNSSASDEDRCVWRAAIRWLESPSSEGVDLDVPVDVAVLAGH